MDTLSYLRSFGSLYAGNGLHLGMNSIVCLESELYFPITGICMLRYQNTLDCHP